MNTKPPKPPKEARREPRYLLAQAVKRGTVCTFNGGPSTGKTLLLMQFMREVQDTAEGEIGTFLKQPFVGGLRMGYVSTDKPADEVYDTAEPFGLDLKRVQLWTADDDDGYEDEQKKTPAAQMRQLIHVLDVMYARSEKLIDLIIIEGYQGYIGVSVLDYSKVTMQLKEMTQWVSAHRNVALIGICHANKAWSDRHLLRATDKTSGTGAIAANSSGSMLLETPAERHSSYYTWTITPRLAAEYALSLRHPTRDDPIFEVAGQAALSDTSPKMTDCKKDLLALFVERPQLRRKDLLASLQPKHTFGTIIKALTQLREIEHTIQKLSEDRDAPYLLVPVPPTPDAAAAA